MKPVHRRHTCLFGAIIDKSAIAFGNQKDALDGVGGLSRKMVLQIRDPGAGGEIPDPECMTGLFGLPRWPSGGRRDGRSARARATPTDRYRGLPRQRGARWD